MGRRKVELKRIEDKSSRQVTFSKRRSGLIKKARELSVLCDVDVAVIIFSSRSKLYHFSSHNNLDDIIKRYQRQCKENESVNVGRAECADPLSYSEILKIDQRCLGDLEELNITDLVQLEKQLEAALGQTKARKTEVMTESIVSLQEQEKLLEAEREQLQKEIEAMEEENNNYNNLVIKHSDITEDNGQSFQPQHATLRLLHS